MPIPQNRNRILRNGHRRRTSQDGPSKSQRNCQLAHPHFSQRSQSLLRLWKISTKTSLTTIIAQPLHDLTKKSRKWEWTPLQDHTFQYLKKKFISYPILRNPDQTKPFTLDTDASEYAIEATLTQEFEDGQHPVAFFSKSLNPAEQNYNIYYRELLAIKEATKFFKHYLLGASHQIRVRSDHDNLKYFRSTHKVTPRQARWMNHLADYNFIIHHLPGKQNTIADLLS